MMEEAGRTGEIQTALVDKPILKNARLPKIIGQGFHAIQGHDDYKEIANIGEQWDVDIANLTGNWESLGGEKWNWITGEKIERDISYWYAFSYFFPNLKSHQFESSTSQSLFAEHRSCRTIIYW